MPETDEEEEEAGAEAGQAVRYSRKLRRIVNECLLFRAEDRPGVEVLREPVRRAVREGGRRMSLARGMRSGAAYVEGDMVLMSPDGYQIGFARDQLPERQVEVYDAA